MPIRRKFAEVGDDIGEYTLALLRHWRPIVSGAALGLASWVYGIANNKAVPTNLYLWVLVGAAIVSGFLAWRDEYTKRLAVADAPDVTLEGTFPAPFMLHARGQACEIRTGPIVQESGVLGVDQVGDQTFQSVSERHTIEFPVVSALRDGDREITPTLFCGEDYRRSAWPEKESKRSGMDEFFRVAERLRRVAIGEPDTSTCTPAGLDDFAERIRRELTFTFDITFWNHERTQQWKRSELLVFEPTTRRAFVRHSGAQVLVSGAARHSSRRRRLSIPILISSTAPV
jgi:hypothetical protein